MHAVKLQIIIRLCIRRCKIIIIRSFPFHPWFGRTIVPIICRQFNINLVCFTSRLLRRHNLKPQVLMLLTLPHHFISISFSIHFHFHFIFIFILRRGRPGQDFSSLDDGSLSLQSRPQSLSWPPPGTHPTGVAAVAVPSMQHRLLQFQSQQPQVSGSHRYLSLRLSGAALISAQQARSLRLRPQRPSGCLALQSRGSACRGPTPCDGDHGPVQQMG